MTPQPARSVAVEEPPPPVDSGAATSAADEPPLVVDLDGTLTRTDLLHETLVKMLVQQPMLFFALPGWLARGKAAFKAEVAARARPEASTLPYEPALLAWLRDERARGRRVVLCTASDRALADVVARGTGLFDEVMASDGTTNLSAEDKARALVRRFGARGFDYAGNARADLAVWSVCRRAIVVGRHQALRARAAKVAQVERDFAPPARPAWRNWRAALRIHQWPKNLLVFLPMLGAHRFDDAPAALAAVLAFFSFSLCASSVYLVNDIVDIENDRRHLRKRNRPFAAGLLSIPQGLGAAALLAIGAFVLAWFGVNPAFTGWLAAYLCLTVSYTFWLKRKIMVDSLVLAALYTLRLLAGAAAAAVDTGFWLLAFSMFLFFSLALVKRYSELRDTFHQGQARTAGRDYAVEDLPLVQTLGIVSGFCSVLVLALYINGDTVARLYPHQEVVWLTVPATLYWVSRIWLKAHRGELDDDPVVFALSDGVSRVTIILFLAALTLAAWH